MVYKATKALISPKLDHVLAIALIVLSLIYFLYDGDAYLHQNVQTYIGDSADYKYLAEYFWGAGHDLGSYDRVFGSDWGHYLDSIPFRGLGVGTVYLVLKGLVYIFSPATAHDAIAMGIVFSAFLKVMFALAYITVYWMCQRRYGTQMGLICLCALLFPSSLWGFTQSTYLGDPLIRFSFLMMTALVFTMFDKPRLRCVVGFMLLWFFAGQLKTQWSMFAVCMIPAFAGLFYYYRMPLRAWCVMIVLALSCPLGVLAVNKIGWDDPTFSPGAAMHINIKSNAQFLADICKKPDPKIEVFCDPKRFKNVWWRVYTGQKATAENFRALDEASKTYVMKQPDFVYAQVFAALGVNSTYITYDNWLVYIIDAFIWAMLLLGCLHFRTWVPASLGLGLWAVPAVANVVAGLNWRYYEVMSGVHLVLALGIMMEWFSMVSARWNKTSDDEQKAKLPRKAVLLLSGGLDSTTVLAIAKSRGFEVYAMSFDYGQRHRHELEAASRIAQEYGAKEHRIATIDLAIFGGSALTQDNIAVPKDRPEGEMSHGIPVTYVPARNTIFLSFALAWAEVLGAYDIFIGVNALDYSGYPDCRPEFIAAYEAMANRATAYAGKGKRKITIHTPLIDLSKAQIIQKGMELGVDYALTTSCYDPAPDGTACGHCDACQLRNKGFQANGLSDPALRDVRKIG